MSEKNLLQNVYLFKNLSEEELEKINEVASLETFAAGDDIFSQKGPATALYVIKFGSVRISQTSDSGDDIEIAVLGTGSHFGEMALIDSEPRSASASTIEKSEIVQINYLELNELLKSDLDIASKFYHSLSHFLAGRLRVTTNDLSYSREKNLSHF